MSAEARAALFVGMFSSDVALEVEDPSLDHAQLFDEEEVVIANAVEKRRREFRAGRLAARRALARLGVPASPIPNDGFRAPIWPSGIVGTITHTRGICAAAVALGTPQSLSLGLDVEPAEPLGEHLLDRIAREDELDFAAHPELAGRIVFSAKEAFYKAQYPISRTYLGFHDAHVRFDETDPGRATVTLLRAAGPLSPEATFACRIRITSGYIATAVDIRGIGPLESVAKSGRKP